MEIQFTNRQGKRYVFDAFRKKYVPATPEELVRQHFCRYLVDERGYPMVGIANEYGLKLNGQSLRCDTVVVKQGKPVALVEYKAPSVPITEAVFEQVARYNLRFGVPYLFVSNGGQTFACRLDPEHESWEYLTGIPAWNEIQL